MLSKAINLIPWRLRDCIRKLPLVAPIQRWVFKKVFKDIKKDHLINAGPARGLVFPIRLPDDKLFWTGTWELEFAETLAAAVPEGGTCLDIGGYRGYFAGLMAVNGASEVHCFEPNPANLAKISRMIELNPSHQIRHHAIALGESDGETTFVVMPDATMGKLDDSTFQNDLNAGESKITVRLSCLDSLIAAGKVAPPDLMKIDVEGAEEMVLKGAEKCLRETHPIIMLEYHSAALARSCHDFLAKCGYEIGFLEGATLSDLRPDAVGHFKAIFNQKGCDEKR